MSKNIFSAIADLFVKKEQAEEPRVPHPTPSAEKEPAPTPAAEASKEPPPPPSSVKPKKVPQKVKQAKHKKSKSNYDKKGFRIITDRDDLSQLFQAGGVRKDRGREEDFAQLFEISQTDVYQRRMLNEKVVHREPPPPTPATDRIKTYPPPQEELDLHGYTAAQAESRTETFIRGARMRRIRTVRVITGKGLHSDGKAVLPDVVEAKIIELKRNRLLLAYKWEKKDKRKSGSLIIYI
jgi:DNA-nicking Smr family endonuclease